MSISSYPSLRSAIWDLLDISSSDNNTAQTDVLVAHREELLYQELRLRQMETAISSTITAAGTVALPSDYLELKNAYLDGSPVTPLQRKSAEWVYQKYPTRSSDAKPKFIAREGVNFIFGPFPDSQYLLKGLYYFKPASQTGSSATLTGIIATAPYLLVFGAAAEIDKALGRDARSQMWEESYERIKNQLRAAEWNELVGGSPPAMTAG